MLRRVHFIARQDKVGTRDERALMQKLAAYMVDRREEWFWKFFGVVSPGVGSAVQNAAPHPIAGRSGKKLSPGPLVE